MPSATAASTGKRRARRRRDGGPLRRRRARTCPTPSSPSSSTPGTCRGPTLLFVGLLLWLLRRRSSSGLGGLGQFGHAVVASRRAGWTSASRRSTRSSPRWTGSRATRAWWCWPRPTARRSWTPRCCGRAASTAGSPSARRTWAGAGDPAGAHPARAAGAGRGPRRGGRRHARHGGGRPRQPGQRGGAGGRPPPPRAGHRRGLRRGAGEDRAGHGARHRALDGDVTTGAENDLDQATRLARQMVGRWGMSPAIGPVSVLPPPGQEQPFGVDGAAPATKELVDREVRRLLDDCYATGWRSCAATGSGSTGWPTSCSTGRRWTRTRRTRPPG